MKILSLDDMLEISQDILTEDQHDQLVTKAEHLAGELAMSIAVKLNIATDPFGDFWQGKNFAGLCASFAPAYKGQKCPPEIDDADADGEWEEA
jgi:hypothetical protein